MESQAGHPAETQDIFFLLNWVPGVGKGADERHGVHGPVEAETGGAEQQPEVEGRQEEEGESPSHHRLLGRGGVVGPGVQFNTNILASILAWKWVMA